MHSHALRSIKTRVTVFTLAVFLISIWSLSLYASRVLRDDMQRLLTEQQYSIVTILASEIDQQIADRLLALEAVASSITVDQLNHPHTLQGPLESRRVFQNLFNAGVFVANAQGVVIADAPVSAKRIGLQLAERDYMMNALQKGQTSVGQAVLGKSAQAPVIVLATPIWDGQGHIIGALAGVINLSTSSFLDKITRHRYGKTGNYFVASPKHRQIITSSDKSRIMQSLPPLGFNVHIDNLARGQEGSARVLNLDNIELLISAKSIPSAGWMMVATLPSQEAFAPIAALQQRMLLATILLTLLAGGVTWWMAARMLKRQLSPLLSATRTLADFSSTNQTPQALATGGQNEVGELLGGFNQLLATLRERENALRESEAYNKVLFSGSHIPLVVMDPATGRMVDCNQAAVDIYQMKTREAVLGLTPVDVSAPVQYDGRSSAEAALDHVNVALSTHSHVFEWRHQRPSGQMWDAEVHLMTFRHGGKLLLQFSLQDISERKRAEADLRIAATAFESQEGMIITDAQLRILRINGACTAITGYTLDEVVGQKPSLFSSGRHDAGFYRDMWASIEAHGAWKGEIWNRRKNGEVFPEWANISAVKGGDGKVSHYVASFIDISQQKSAEDEIKHLAFYDPLTRLPNRRLLMDRLRRALVAGSRDDVGGALFFIDLDNFKTLNDTLGHDKGDMLLESVAKRLSATVREEDTVARLGGDEFVIMIDGLSLSAREAADHARQVGEKLLAAFAQPHDLAGVSYHCTASVGIALFSWETDTVDELLKRADLAMYQAKAAGRNTLRFFDPQMQQTVMARAALESDLRQGLLDHQLLLHYQPQVDDHNRITGAEALVRWQHPQRGMISPADFIPLAEETGLILPLGHWVLETACAQLVAWAQQPHTAQLTVSVNVSAHQFHQSDFVAQVLAVLQRTGANPHRLKLELTETLLVSNFDEVIEKMFALKGWGVGFALDDFGTGYSSLAYLKRMPLDQLKIDQSFVRDVLIDTNDAAIASTIIALAQSLGLGVIAEGVETQAHRDFLAAAGCPAYQGYFFSRPVPIDKLDQLLQNQA